LASSLPHTRKPAPSAGSEERFRRLTEAAPGFIWAADANGEVTYANQRIYEYTGLDPGRGAANWARERMHPDDYPRRTEAWKQAIAQGSGFELEVRIRRHDDAYRWFLMRVTPVRDAAGRVVEWYGSGIDIDQRKQAEEELRAAAIEKAQLAAALTEADRRKDEFIAVLAHELRNPLAPVRNAIEILRATPSPSPRLQWTHDVIDRQVRQLSRLVDDLLDVSRITSGKIELRRERVQLSEAVHIALEGCRPMIERCGHELTVRIPREPIWLDADVARIAQVLSNLLNNAAKYTRPGGHIWLTAERSGWQVAIGVRDNGIGIPPEMLGSIFDMFTQAAGKDHSQGGLGIGLTLVRRLVELHGGTVEARSEGIGRGSQFVVRLPVSATDAANDERVKDEAQPANRGARRILVVDDNRDAADSLCMLLASRGHDVRAAYDGLEAVGAAVTFRPDVVLLDIGLPKLSGNDAARRIREARGDGVLLVAVTGWGQEEDRKRAQEAGFDHHLTKPVDPQAITRLIDGA
jgi:two-component system CheB/CheR fusion protein